VGAAKDVWYWAEGTLGNEPPILYGADVLLWGIAISLLAAAALTSRSTT